MYRVTVLFLIMLLSLMNNVSAGTQQPIDLSIQVEGQSQTISNSEQSDSGGGGSGSTITFSKKGNKESIKIQSDKLMYKLKQGESKQLKLKFQNNDKNSITMTLQNPDLQNILKFPQESFEIGANEIKEISVDIITSENTIPRLYLGNIILKGENREYGQIAVAVEVISHKISLELDIDLIDNQISPGGELVAIINLNNIESSNPLDILIEYSLKDTNNEDIFREQEIRTIEKQDNVTKVFTLPSNIAAGNYIVQVKTVYGNQISSSSRWFTLSKEAPNKIGIILVLVILVGVLIYKFRKRDVIWFKELGKSTKTTIFGNSKEKDQLLSQAYYNQSATRGLKQQLKQLEYIHRQGLIKGKEYQEKRVEMQQKLNDLKNRR